MWVLELGYLIPMYWPEEEAALTVAADNFNTLVYTHLLPPALGFKHGSASARSASHSAPAAAERSR
jgi:hypothetical protein